MKVKIYRKTSVLLILSVIISACVKDELPEIPYENNPVFNVTGTIGSESIDLHAGKNEAYMHTEIEEWNNVDLYSGTLSNGNESFSISLFKSNIDIPTLDSNFVELSKYKVAENHGVITLLKITPEDFEHNQFIENIKWKIDGESQSGIKLAITEPGIYKVCAEILFVTGSTQSTCNSIIVGYKRNAEFQLKWNMLENDVIQSYIEAPSNSISSIRWYLNNKFVSDSLQYKYNGEVDSFHLKAEIIFQNGTNAEREVYIDRYSKSSSIEDYANKEQQTILRWDNKVQFTIEKNGVLYKSIQNSSDNAQFIVSKISNYQSSEAGHQVKKLKGTLNIPFINTSTGEIKNSELKIEIGVGY